MVPIPTQADLQQALGLPRSPELPALGSDWDTPGQGEGAGYEPGAPHPDLEELEPVGPLYGGDLPAWAAVVLYAPAVALGGGLGWSLAGAVLAWLWGGR